ATLPAGEPFSGCVGQAVRVAVAGAEQVATPVYLRAVGAVHRILLPPPDRWRGGLGRATPLRPFPRRGAGGRRRPRTSRGAGSARPAAARGASEAAARGRGVRVRWDAARSEDERTRPHCLPHWCDKWERIARGQSP